MRIGRLIVLKGWQLSILIALISISITFSLVFPQFIGESVNEPDRFFINIGFFGLLSFILFNYLAWKLYLREQTQVKYKNWVKSFNTSQTGNNSLSKSVNSYRSSKLSDYELKIKEHNEQIEEHRKKMQKSPDSLYTSANTCPNCGQRAYYKLKKCPKCNTSL